MRTVEDKKRVLQEMLGRGDTMVCVDARHPEVMVPPMHQDKADLRLILNLGFRNPIRLLSDGVRADLRFSGTLFSCWLPYESLWAVYNPNTGEGKIWPEHLPEELAHLLPVPGEKNPPTPTIPLRGRSKEPESGGVSSEVIPLQAADRRRSLPRPGRPSSKQAGPAGKRQAGRKPFLRVIKGSRED